MAYEHIQKLPDNLISQIAAGEVIERPASGLKELLDNAIDSGATKIEARVDKGGTGRIEVLDNGSGISEEDLPLAFERHATSKIRSFDDLMSAMTMGFRGEALASMASVARASIVTKREGERVGRKIVCENGVMGAIEPAACEPGTRVTIQDLFFFVPARRKFLKSETTEFNNCRAAFLRSALSRPDIAFTLLRDGKKNLAFPAQTPRERAEAVLGPQVGPKLVPLAASSGVMTLEGFAAPVRALPTGQEFQWLFVNKRFTRDRILASAAREALAETQGLGREKDVAYVAFLSIPSSEIDVNAHPAKTETRFKDARGARQFLKQALLETFAALPKSESDAGDDTGDPFGQQPSGHSGSPGGWSANRSAHTPSSGGQDAPWRSQGSSGGFSRGGSGGHGGNPFSRDSAPRAGRSMDFGFGSSPAGFPKDWPPANWREEAQSNPHSNPNSPSQEAGADANRIGFAGLDSDQDIFGSPDEETSAAGSSGRAAGTHADLGSDGGDGSRFEGESGFQSPAGLPPVRLPASGLWLIDGAQGAVLVPHSALPVANLAASLAQAALSGEVLSETLLEPALAPLSERDRTALAPWKAILEKLGAQIEPTPEGWLAVGLPDGLPCADWAGVCEALSVEHPADFEPLALARAALAMSETCALGEADPHDRLDGFWGTGVAFAALLPGATGRGA